MSDFSKYFMPDECYLNIKVKNFEELIHNFSKIFIEKNFVNTDWENSILVREQRYPTGLDMGMHYIAIPHTYSEFVNVSLIVPVLLKNKIDFIHMGSQETKIKVDVIFFLLIKESHQQIDVLQKILSLSNQEDFINEMKSAKDSQHIYDIIIKNLNSGGI